MQAQDTGRKVSLVSPKEAAALLRVTPNTMAKWRLAGDGPAFLKIGFRVFYDEETLHAWLASRVRRSTSDAAAA